MTRDAWEIGRLTLDGVYFRSAKVQDQKGSKTDNSCISGEVKVDLRSSARHRNVRTVEESCYGVIKTFYLHFMWPPSAPHLRSATTKTRIDPNKITEVPWMVVADCRWFGPLGQLHETGLVQLRPDDDWTQTCPYIRLQDCHAMNVVFWPVKPLRTYRSLLQKILSKNYNEESDEEEKEEDNEDEEDKNDLVVIGHHDVINVQVRQR
jgi:hypothetical protein